MTDPNRHHLDARLERIWDVVYAQVFANLISEKMGSTANMNARACADNAVIRIIVDGGPTTSVADDTVKRCEREMRAYGTLRAPAKPPESA